MNIINYNKKINCIRRNAKYSQHITNNPVLFFKKNNKHFFIKF
jgi:hypothetical protein